MVSKISSQTGGKNRIIIVAAIGRPEASSFWLVPPESIGCEKAPNVAGAAGCRWRYSQLGRRRRRQLGSVVSAANAAFGANGGDTTGARAALAPLQQQGANNRLAWAREKTGFANSFAKRAGQQKVFKEESQTKPTTTTTTTSSSDSIESRISSSRRAGAGLAGVGSSLQHSSSLEEPQAASKSKRIAKSGEPSPSVAARARGAEREFFCNEPLAVNETSGNPRRPFTPFELHSGERRRRRRKRREQPATTTRELEEKSKATTAKAGSRSSRNGDLNRLFGCPRRAPPAAPLMLALMFVSAACCLAGASCSAAGWQQGKQAATTGGQQQVANVGVGRPVSEASGRRVLRQISPTSRRPSSELPVAAAQHSAQQQQQQHSAAGQPQQSVPYKTFYVTCACEWKSNLFVPKANDIHFAQSSSAAAAPTGEQQQANSQPESSVVYETFNTNANNNYQNSRTGAFGQSVQQPVQLQFQQQQDGSRTMLSTDSKALILALPIVMSQSFAGYEPACSIRLIVPRNMRILAKLTSRRLTFAQQQLEGEQSALDGQPQVWLNVSQSEFSETEHKTIETAGNVLAFRFLLERFASRQAPDTRFQVVLTAFQTLSENSDLSGAGGGLTQQQAAGGLPQSGRPPFQLDPNAQFICDQQRLISAELACDGFKNCQDGHDEELATCLALRHPELAGQPAGNSDPNSIGNQLGASSGGSPAGDATLAKGGDDRAPVLVRVWHWARDTNSLAGFLLGFLLVLLILTCCSCCSYLAYLAWRRLRRWRCERLVERGGDQARESGEADSLAAQNIENAARWKRSLAEEERQRQIERRQRAQQQQSHRPGQPSRLQSILKKPSSGGGALPLSFGAGQRPVEPPPAAPARPTRANQQQHQHGAIPSHQAGESRAATPSSKRGALSSSLTQPGSAGGGDFRPTPAKRLTRPTRPVPVPGERAGSTSQHQVGEQRASSVSRTMTTTNSTTGTRRVTTYHYSSGSTRYSESYLQRLAAEQQQQQSSGGSGGGGSLSTPSPSPVAVTGVRPIASTTPAPPSGTDVNYSKREPSPKSSLI